MRNAIAEALSRIQKITEENKSQVIHTSQISRSDREILIHHHWLEEIMRGWYLSVRPDMTLGESTTWTINYLDFVAAYLKHYHRVNYCLSAESSLDLHVGNLSVQKQLVVIVLEGAGNVIQLPHQTSLLTYADAKNFPEERTILNNLQVMTLTYSLCKVTPKYFSSFPQDAEIALRSVEDPSEFLRVIAKYHLKASAERLIGAYSFLGLTKMADALKKGLLDIGMIVYGKNPFQMESPSLANIASTSPHALRIYGMWREMREAVIANFPKPPGMPKNYTKLLGQMNEKYAQDAYNSLSIEGFKVDEQLIEKVKNPDWRPDLDRKDRQLVDALAARGYYETFQLVKKSVEMIFSGAQPGKVVSENLQMWFQKLFTPCVQAGIFPAEDLFGYRRHQVYIRSSKHIPLSCEYLKEAMEAFYQCLSEESHPAVRSILGHFIFVYIHPYMDGNGRIGRFLMNVMLASGGYPWTIIHVANRNSYMKALETASVERDITPFTQFVASEMDI